MATPSSINNPTTCFPSPSPPRPFSSSNPKLIPSPSLPRRALRLAKCGGGGGEVPKEGLEAALSGAVWEQVEELLRKEENRGLLQGLEKAEERVDKARRALEDLQRQKLEAEQLKDQVSLLQARENQIAESQQEILEARAMIEEAQRSLSLGTASEAVNKEQERLESVKAACVSAIVGTLAGLPIYSSQVTSIVQLLLPSAVTFISCALFGVTFRYAVRRDLDNIQLKTGTAAAFGFAKGAYFTLADNTISILVECRGWCNELLCIVGLGTLAGGPPLELNPASFLSHSTDGALLVAENLLVFVFAAVSLDFCFKTGLLGPFPINNNKTDSEANTLD